MGVLRTGLIYLVVYTLMVYYCIKFSLLILVLFLTKANARFWKVKKRPYPPQCLIDKELGEHKTASINGINLHYVEKGDNKKPLMLFLHGCPEFWYSWRYQMKEFSKDYWVVAVDLRGYNESDKPAGIENYKIDLLVADVRELVNHLGRKRFILVAHDWGSIIAFHYVHKHMDTIDRYICMDAPSVEAWSNQITKSWSQFRKSWYMIFFQAPFLPEYMQRMFDFKMFNIIYKSAHITADDIEAYKYVFSKKDAQTPPINYYRANVLDIVTGAVTIPEPQNYAHGLYLHGENDLYVIDEFVKILPKMYQNLEAKIVPNGSHFVQQDQPEAVNRLMREFLAKK